MGFSNGSAIKNPPTMQETQEMQVQSLGREDPWRRKWQPVPVFLPGKPHGAWWAIVYRVAKELDTTEQLSTHSTFL